jgi:hypothetical protein
MHRHRGKFTLNTPGLGVAKMLLVVLIAISVSRGSDLGMLMYSDV